MSFNALHRITTGLLIIIVLLLLTNCSSSLCISQADIFFETIKDTIKAKPDGIAKGDYYTYWKKSNLTLKGASKVTVVISDNTINLCNDPGEVIQIDASNPRSYVTNSTFAKDDEVTFTLKPFLQNTKVTEKDCNNSNPAVWVDSETICRYGKLYDDNSFDNKYIGSIYSSIIGNDSNNPASNIWYNTSEHRKWLQGVFFSGQRIKTKPKDLAIRTITKENCQNAQKGIAVPAKMFKNTTFLLNKQCNNICGIQYTTNDKSRLTETGRITNNCFHSLAQAVDKKDTTRVVSYIQGLQGIFIDGTTHKPLHNLKSFGEIAPGLLSGANTDSDKMYTSPQDNTQITLYISGADTQSKVRSKRIIVMLSNGQTLEFFDPKDINEKVIRTLISQGLRIISVDVSAQNKVVRSTPLSGGYNIIVHRTCNKAIRYSLYAYVGEHNPADSNIQPGDPATIPIDFTNGNTFTFKTSTKGNVYYGIKDNGDGYDNNTGSITLTAKVRRKKSTIISHTINTIIDRIMVILYGNSSIGSSSFGNGAVGTVYNTFSSPYFINLIYVALLLSIIINGLLFTLGMMRMPQLEFIILIVKLAIVMKLLSGTSWTFFNEYLFKLFTYGSADLINIMSGQSSADTDFGFVDASLSRFGRYETWLQILGLFFAGPVGWLIMFCIFWSFLMLLSALCKACIVYLLSIVLVALLLCMSPIFITFLLFRRTKAIFDAWIKILAQTIMQPVLAFSALALLNQIVFLLLSQVLNYDVCTDCILNVKISDDIDQFCLIDFFVPYGFNPTAKIQDHLASTLSSGGSTFFGIPMPIATVIMLVIITHTLNSFVSKAISLSSVLFGAFGAEITGVSQQFSQSMLGIVGMDQDSRQRRAMQKYYREMDQQKLDKGPPRAKPKK